MYIKAKKGYNVIINDINLSLQHGKDYVYIDDEKFNNSEDAKKLSSLIEIKDSLPKSVKKTTGVQRVKSMKAAENAFVLTETTATEKHTGAVVFDPNQEAKTNVQAKTTLDTPVKQESNEPVKTEPNPEPPVQPEVKAENKTQESTQKSEAKESKAPEVQQEQVTEKAEEKKRGRPKKE